MTPIGARRGKNLPHGNWRDSLKLIDSPAKHPKVSKDQWVENVGTGPLQRPKILSSHKMRQMTTTTFRIVFMGPAMGM
jgi:hypothetical protein